MCPYILRIEINNTLVSPLNDGHQVPRIIVTKAFERITQKTEKDKKFKVLRCQRADNQRYFIPFIVLGNFDDKEDADDYFDDILDDLYGTNGIFLRSTVIRSRFRGCPRGKQM